MTNIDLPMKAEVLRPYTNIATTIEEVEGKKVHEGFGGSCVQKNIRLAEILREGGLKVSHLLTASNNTLHEMLSIEKHGGTALADPSRGWFNPIRFLIGHQNGWSRETPAYPYNDHAKTTISATPLSDDLIEVVTTMDTGSEPMELKEDYFTKDAREIPIPPIVEAAVTLVKGKFSFISVQPETDGVFELQVPFNKPERAVAKIWGQGSIPQRRESEFNDRVDAALERHPFTRQELFALIGRSAGHLEEVRDRLEDPAAAVEHFNQELQKLRDEYAKKSLTMTDEQANQLTQNFQQVLRAHKS